MLLNLIRAVFVLVVAGLGVRLARIAGVSQLNPILLFIGVMIVGIIIIVADLMTPRKRIQTISAVYFGIIVGLILSNLVQSAFEPTLLSLPDDQRQALSALLMIFICYICVSTLLQTKDDFRFIIPYMEFSKEVKGARPLVLDTSVVIDGRIADIAAAGFVPGRLVVPRFVLAELQNIADSDDAMRRGRGRRFRGFRRQRRIGQGHPGPRRQGRFGTADSRENGRAGRRRRDTGEGRDLSKLRFT